jgi:hypothetical protein
VHRYPSWHQRIPCSADNYICRPRRQYALKTVVVPELRHSGIVAEALASLVQNRVIEAHQALQDFRYFLAEPPSGPSISRTHPVQLDGGTIAFVKRRRANSRR